MSSSVLPQDASRRRGVIAVICQAFTGSSRASGAMAPSADTSRFLVIRRSQTVTAPGAWCFPGGGVESGESEPEALCRELYEELAIQRPIPGQRIWSSRSQRGVQLAWWTVAIDAEEVIVPNPEEVAAVRWWTPAEMRATGKLLESNELFLRHWETLPAINMRFPVSKRPTRCGRGFSDPAMDSIRECTCDQTRSVFPFFPVCPSLLSILRPAPIR